MPRYYFDIADKVDQIGVELADDEAAIAEAKLTVAKLAEFDLPPAGYKEWLCIVRDQFGNQITRQSSAE